MYHMSRPNRLHNRIQGGLLLIDDMKMVVTNTIRHFLMSGCRSDKQVHIVVHGREFLRQSRTEKARASSDENTTTHCSTTSAELLDLLGRKIQHGFGQARIDPDPECMIHNTVRIHELSAYAVILADHIRLS